MSAARYSKVAVILHWLIALGIFIMFGIGWFMANLPKKAPDQSTFDLSVKNPNGNEEVAHHSPQNIMAEIALLDA